MSMHKKDKGKSKAVMENRVPPRQEKKEVADREEVALEKEIQEHLAWIHMIEGMDDQQLENYIKNSSHILNNVKMEKGEISKRVRRVQKPKSTAYTGIMATVWKYHREDDEDNSTGSA